MKIKEELLTVNEYSRPANKLRKVLGIVMHWTATPMQSAQGVKNYFESLKDGKNGYGSAHYVVGIEGEVIQMIPDDEVAYHCGSSKLDPTSKKVYTDLARVLFGNFASEKSSPNLCTIGIEMCVTDKDGTFRAKTIESAIELVAGLCKKHDLTWERIVTHNQVVGWKDCPKLWTDFPEKFDDFVQRVNKRIKKKEQ